MKCLWDGCLSSVVESTARFPGEAVISVSGVCVIGHDRHVLFVDTIACDMRSIELRKVLDWFTLAAHRASQLAWHRVGHRREAPFVWHIDLGLAEVAFGVCIVHVGHRVTHSDHLRTDLSTCQLGSFTCSNKHIQHISLHLNCVNSEPWCQSWPPILTFIRVFIVSRPSSLLLRCTRCLTAGSCNTHGPATSLSIKQDSIDQVLCSVVYHLLAFTHSVNGLWLL